jgi:hypothetical protein
MSAPAMQLTSKPSPIQALAPLANGFIMSRVLYECLALGVFDALRDDCRSTDELAERLGAHPGALYRLVRALASVGLFTEVKSRHFRLTPAGALLRSDVPGSLARMGFQIELMWPVWGCLGHSLKSGAAAFEQAHGADLFTYLTEHPQAGRQFDEAMSAFVSQSTEGIVATFDFARFDRIVDVGGGNGTLIAAILKRHARVRGVVFDLPPVVERARAQISSAGLSDRCECVAGDFFSAALPTGDAYILASILHDWDDEHATTILHNCRRSMSAGTTLVIAEALIPPGEQPSFAKILDLTMLVVNGGRQRTEAESRDMLARAGFELKRVIPTWSSTETSILEAVAV